MKLIPNLWTITHNTQAGSLKPSLFPSNYMFIPGDVCVCVCGGELIGISSQSLEFNLLIA